MICASAQNVSAPFDTSQLYWIALGAARADRYSPASLFFASPDGSALVPALQDLPRFTAALAEAIAATPGAQFASGLQELLTDLTTAATLPVPVYPSAGDTGVSGTVLWARSFNYFKWNPITQKKDIPVISCIGGLQADIAANGYSGPPAYSPANSCIQFRFQFQSFTEVCAGDAVTFDIAQGQYALCATNVQRA